MKKCKLFLLFLCFFLWSGIIQIHYAADLKDIKVLSDSIIMLVIDDGHITYHKINQTAWNDDQVHESPVSIEDAVLPENYSIVSMDDSNYSNALHPLKIGRKSKGRYFSPVKKNTVILRHFLYLKLPRKMLSGKTYTVRLSNLIENTNEISITYKPDENISPAIHVNMIGYSTRSEMKYAYVYHWMGDMGSLNLDAYAGNEFYLKDANTGETVFTGILSLRKDLETGEPDTYNANDSYNYCMSDVYECNFSEFNIPGKYRVQVKGLAASYPFEIKVDAYRTAFIHTTRGLYHHRSGIERDLPYSEWYKGVDHRPGVNGFRIEYSNWRYMDGSNAFTELPENATGEIFPDNPGDWMPEKQDAWGWGGYFDSGDWDRRHIHLIVSSYLLTAFELAPENFVDNELNIPESGNGVPDIIDEARWTIDMLRRLQGPTGGICGGMEENEHPNPEENSVTDSRPWYVYAEEPAASYNLAAANAQLAYCLLLAGKTNELDSLLSQAKRVYQWAGNNMREGDEQKVNIYRMRAAAWLFKYTGEMNYHDQFIVDYNNGVKDDFAFYAYLTTLHPDVKKEITDEITSSIIEKANKLVEAGEQRADRWANFDLWGFHRVGSATTPYIYPLIFAYRLTDNKKYLNYAYTTCDYFMGANPINKVYVTGLGENSVREVLNKDAWFDNKEEMIPGIVPYGLHTYGSWMEGAGKNVYQPLPNFNTCYPEWRTWPSHEMWFENRYLIIQNEYTVQQTIGPAAAAYGYLTGTIHPEDIKPLSVHINLDTLRVYTGHRKQLLAGVSPYNASDKSVKWKSLNHEICTVSNGIVQGVSAGKTKVLIESEVAELSDTCLVIVKQTVPIDGINIIEDELKIQEGQNDTLHVLFLPENATNKKMYWTSGDSAVAVVNTFGIATAHKPGNIYVYAISEYGNKTDSCLITVTAAPQFSYPAGSHHVPGKIEFENYDSGGNGISFFDTDAENQGDIYRNDAVDIQKTKDVDQGFNIGWIKDGEWLEYTVDVSQTKKYYIKIRYSSAGESGNISILRDEDVLHNITVTGTGGWQIWETKTDSLQLEEGQQILRFSFHSGNDYLFNLNWIEFLDDLKHQNTSIWYPVKTNEVMIYPNPVINNNFIVAFDLQTTELPQIIETSIMSIHGQLLHEKLFVLNYQEQKVLYSKLDLPPGLYLMQITIPRLKKTITKRFLVL